MDGSARRNGTVFMKLGFAIPAVLVCSLAAAPKLSAQNQPTNPPAAPQQNGQPAAQPKNSPPPAQDPSRSKQQQNQNPFPEDTNDVPVMPSKNTPDLPPGTNEAGAPRTPLPPEDADPVRTPEEEGAAAAEQDKGSSSSLAGMGDLLPGPDDADTQPPDRRGRKAQQPAPEHHETAAEDENVGKYYLDNKDWKAALSRFQSALVLDPDNPDVYWGLAEAERHVGDFAGARANYLKVTEYDPDSRHGKDARKALQDPEIANAKAAAAQPAASQ
jgi:tetratricopeptide (TPR) repeat protein